MITRSNLSAWASRRAIWRLVVLAIATAVLAGLAEHNVAQGLLQATITRISVGPAGQQGNNISWGGVTISSDGRYVAFTSDSSNLVVGDLNNKRDVFWLDRWTGAKRLISISSSGTQGNGDSSSPVISADGMQVAFRSDATNLVPGGSQKGIYVHDIPSGETIYAAVVVSDEEHSVHRPSFSPDLRFVAHKAGHMAPSIGGRCWLHDRETGITERISVPEEGGSETRVGVCDYPSVSADGRYVAFRTLSKLVPEDTNDHRDIYLRDRQLATTSCISCPSEGASDANSDYPYLSPDGRYLVFVSWANNLDAIGAPPNPTGRSFTYLYDRVAGSLRFVHYQYGTGACGLSQDGRYMAADGAYIYDLQTGHMEPLPPWPADWLDYESGSAYAPCLSADGRSFVFETEAAGLVSGDTNNSWDTFVHDRWPQQTPTITVTPTTEPAPEGSRLYLPIILRE
jgi:Tol biopolymer transport system component